MISRFLLFLLLVCPLLAQTPKPPEFRWDPPNGLPGAYYATKDLSGSIVINKYDGPIDFDWTINKPIVGQASNFSVRWQGFIKPQFTETYTFTVRLDDGARLWVNNVLLVDSWVGGSARDVTGKISLTANTGYAIKLEYFQSTGPAHIQLSWSSPSLPQEIIPLKNFYLGMTGLKYNLYRSLSSTGSAATKVNATPFTSPPTTDSSTLTVGTAYYYYFTAVLGTQQSGKSNIVKFTPVIPPPPPIPSPESVTVK